MKRRIGGILYLLTLLLGALFLYRQRAKLATLAEFPPSYLLAYFLYGILPFFLLAYHFKLNILLFKLRLPFKEWFGLSVSNTMYNYLLPMRGGLAFRAVYMKRQYGFSFANYTSFLTGAYLIDFLVAAVTASVLGGLIHSLLPPQLLAAVALFAGLFILAFLWLMLGTMHLSWLSNNMLARFLKNAVEGLHAYRSAPRILLQMMGVELLFILALALRLYIAFQLLGVEVGFLPVAFIQSLVVFSMVLSITPGNLGIKEGIIGLLAASLGIPLDQALLAAVLDRMVAMLLVFLLGFICSHYLLKASTPDDKKADNVPQRKDQQP